MNRHIDFETLQDYAEGLLSHEEEAPVREHLEHCPDCKRELQVVRSLLEDVGGLPAEAHPSRDLWPQIEWRMGAEGRERAPGTSPEVSRRRGGRQVTLKAWQLAAAGIALALFSGAAVWMALAGTGVGTAPSGAVATAPLAESPALPAGWNTALEEYHDAVADLEDVLERGRGVLDEETIRILEENLQTINDAIDDAQEALAQDPGSRVLGRLLTENLRRKVDLLRHAAAVVYQNT